MLTLDVVTKDLAVTLGSSLSKSLSSLAAARHGCLLFGWTAKCLSFCERCELLAYVEPANNDCVSLYSCNAPLCACTASLLADWLRAL